jgi:hypothetical protein
MTQTRLPLSKAPTCPDCIRCGGKTRLFGIEPHLTAARTDLHTYVCASCDAVQTEIVRRAVPLTVVRKRGNGE